MISKPNLAKPELAPKYDPAAIESRIYQMWTDAEVFAASNTSERDPYVIVIPLPNVTAALHMGHGLNHTIQDLLIRFERMRGREALWLPGTDHAGIATQNVVERQVVAEGKTRHDLGREAFVELVWEHVKQTGGAILKGSRVGSLRVPTRRERRAGDEENDDREVIRARRGILPLCDLRGRVG